MKFRSLAVNQFKKFTVPTQLDGMVDGLNLVVGPNEMGKSTLLDALRAVLFERHASKARAITDLQNDRSGAAPVVEATFELDDGSYTITKRFIKRPYARLDCPDGRKLEGDAAEAMLRDLLGFSESAVRGASPESLGMWGVLWVQQGHSFGAPELSGSARQRLGGILESEVGDVLGGRRGRELPQIIQQRLADWLTPAQSRPRGAYKAALDEVAQLEADLEELRAQREDLSETLERLAATTERLERLDRGEQDRADQAALQTARDELRRDDELAARIDTEQVRLEQRRRALDDATRALAARSDLRQRLAADQASLTASRLQLDELEDRDREWREQLAQLRESARVAAQAVADAEAVESRSQAVLAAVAWAQQIQQLAAAEAAAVEAQTRLRSARQQADAILVTDAALHEIRSAATRLDRVEAQLRAAATLVTFDFPPERRHGVEVGDGPLTEATRSIPVIEPLTIRIPERGAITIEPAIRDRDQLLRERADATSELRRALAQAGATNLADAEDQHARRQRFDRDRELAQTELLLHAPGADIAALSDELAGLRSRLAARQAELELNALPARADAEADARAAAEQLLAARQAARVAGAAADSHDHALGDHRQQLSDLRAAVKLGAAQLDRARVELEAAVAEMADHDLAEAQRDASIALDGHERALAALQASRSETAREQLEARILRLANTIRQRGTDRTNLRVEISGLQARLESLEAGGIDERLEQRERELERARDRLGRITHEIEVLRLLLEVLQEAEHEAKERYLFPVISRVRPYLQRLFPEAEIEMDEDLNVTAISRAGAYQESFEHLSMGTQEQIAVLIRLAFAELLAERGQPAAVILDDALVFSDDLRMDTMFDILTHAARQMQVIVFTCRAQLFEGLGAKQLQLRDGDPEQLRSA